MVYQCQYASNRVKRISSGKCRIKAITKHIRAVLYTNGIYEASLIFFETHLISGRIKCKLLQVSVDNLNFQVAGCFTIRQNRAIDAVNFQDNIIFRFRNSVPFYVNLNWNIRNSVSDINNS